jgi:hypothetical protein
MLWCGDMKVALFHGTHHGDGFRLEAGAAITHAAQFGKFANIVHVAAIHEEYPDGDVLLATSLLAHGVCAQRTRIDAKDWYVYDVPQWDTVQSIDWFAKHSGEPYDLIGAIESVFPLHHTGGRGWYCNEAVAASVGVANFAVDPAEFSELVDMIGKNITHEFFKAKDAPQ